ncbi:MAG: BlaI/MecI/CopY family transcriptional regulator [Armatimonadota bacterium]|nr:BlaI/MecI/CopY family transcriptional regulator [Armatimonadota bacterium]
MQKKIKSDATTFESDQDTQTIKRTKPSALPPLSEVQMEIMNAVWDGGEATLGEIWKMLSARRTVARNTIQTLLTRLVEKGWLGYRVTGKTFHYRATRPRETTLRDMAERFVAGTFRGSTEGLVLTLLESQLLSQDEAARIRAMIEQAEHNAE